MLCDEWQGAAEHPVWEEAVNCPVRSQTALTRVKTTHHVLELQAVKGAHAVAS